MSSTTRPPRPLTPEQQAVRDEMQPYVVVTWLASALAMPAEVLLPLARRARRRDGVPLGPSAVGAANGVLAALAVARLRDRPGLWQHRPVVLPALAWGLLAPFAARERLVVLRGRSPLWGFAVPLPSSAVQVASVLGTVARLRRARGGRTAG